MRLLRRLIVVFFILVTAGFAAYQVWHYMTDDNSAPVITCSEDTLQLSIDADESELLQGMSATDNHDGDVTKSLVVVSLSKFSTPGTRRVNYAAFDSKSNVATFSRTLVYTDYTSPHFSISSPLIFNAGGGTPALLDIVSAEDCLDGDISSLIKLFYGESTYVYYSEPGETAVSFQVTNSAGDTSTINVALEYIDSEDYALDRPALSDYLIYTGIGEAPEYTGYIKGYLSGESVISFGKNSRYEAEQVKVDDSAVDYNTPGTYRVTYTLYEDAKEKEALGYVTQYVVVEGQVTDNAE